MERIKLDSTFSNLLILAYDASASYFFFQNNHDNGFSKKAMFSG